MFYFLPTFQDHYSENSHVTVPKVLGSAHGISVLAGDIRNGATQEHGVACHIEVTVKVDVATLQHFALHEANVVGIRNGAANLLNHAF